jgi:transcriptional regulator with XRE-family HTH domain
MPRGDFVSPNAVDIHVGSRAKKIRIFRNINLFQLADFLKIEPEQLARCEAGSQRFSAECLLRLCEALDTTPSFLFSGLLMSSYSAANRPYDSYARHVNDNRVSDSIAVH